jgi:hypothetical protein
VLTAEDAWVDDNGKLWWLIQFTNVSTTTVTEFFYNCEKGGSPVVIASRDATPIIGDGTSHTFDSIWNASASLFLGSRGVVAGSSVENTVGIIHFPDGAFVATLSTLATAEVDRTFGCIETETFRAAMQFNETVAPDHIDSVIWTQKKGRNGNPDDPIQGQFGFFFSGRGFDGITIEGELAGASNSIMILSGSDSRFNVAVGDFFSQMAGQDFLRFIIVKGDVSNLSCAPKYYNISPGQPQTWVPVMYDPTLGVKVTGNSANDMGNGAIIANGVGKTVT